MRHSEIGHCNLGFLCRIVVPPVSFGQAVPSLCRAPSSAVEQVCASCLTILQLLLQFATPPPRPPRQCHLLSPGHLLPRDHPVLVRVEQTGQQSEYPAERSLSNICTTGMKNWPQEEQLKL